MEVLCASTPPCRNHLWGGRFGNVRVEKFLNERLWRACEEGDQRNTRFLSSKKASVEAGDHKGIVVHLLPATEMEKVSTGFIQSSDFSQECSEI